MRPLSRIAALTALAALVAAAPAHAVKPREKLRALGPAKVVKPFKGKATTRPLASAAALFDHGGFGGAIEPACCHIPSEIGGAVGDTQFVQVDAARITVSDRFGAVKRQQNLDAFCGPGTGEPRVLYDRFSKRWFIVSHTVSSPQVICVHTSRTSSAAGAYHVTAYGLPGAGGPSSNLRIGMDTDGLFIVFDQFTAGSVYARTGAIALSKAYLTAGRVQSVGFYDGLPPLTPPVVEDAARPGSYFLGTDPAGDKLKVYQATSMHRGGPLAPKFEVAVPAYTNALAASQPGAPDSILVGDVTFKGSSYQVGGLLMNTHTINRGGRPTARWYAIDTDSEVLARAGRLSESTTSDDFAPSLAAAGDAVFFTWTATDVRHATPSKRHPPRMSYAAYKTGDASTNKFGNIGATGDVYAPGGGESTWGRGQVTIAPRGFNNCPDGTYAFAIGQIAAAPTLWQGVVKKFGTC